MVLAPYLPRQQRNRKTFDLKYSAVLRSILDRALSEGTMWQMRNDQLLQKEWEEHLETTTFPKTMFSVKRLLTDLVQFWIANWWVTPNGSLSCISDESAQRFRKWVHQCSTPLSDNVNRLRFQSPHGRITRGFYHASWAHRYSKGHFMLASICVHLHTFISQQTRHFSFLFWESQNC